MDCHGGGLRSTAYSFAPTQGTSDRTRTSSFATRSLR